MSQGDLEWLHGGQWLSVLCVVQGDVRLYHNSEFKREILMSDIARVERIRSGAFKSKKVLAVYLRSGHEYYFKAKTKTEARRWQEILGNSSAISLAKPVSGSSPMSSSSYNSATSSPSLQGSLIDSFPDL